MQTWQAELNQLIQTEAELKKELAINGSAEKFFRSAEGGHLPLSITPYYARRIAETGSPALWRMAVPNSEELSIQSYETADPLAEEGFQPVSRCIHRYKDRILLLVTDSCALYCRHCFRRRFTGVGEGGIGDVDLGSALEYLRHHPEIHELILSGGDPLMLTNLRLEEILSRFRATRSELVIRLSTRMPAVLPSRFTDGLISLLAGASPLWLVVHINHPDELGRETLETLSRLSSAGIPILSQTVLLRGVNDSPEILQRLYYSLLELKVRPYYLFQGDLAVGTAYFRVNLRRGLAIYQALQQRVSGLALPVYAVDLPGGGGKVRLHSGSIQREEEGAYLLKDVRGRLYRYPIEWPDEADWGENW